ncbi:MAG: Ca2+/H+ antiporter, family [Acidobacteriota bacterium]|jgi:putative Ca2+/H+ antiporter (TMEM165/GDT1 family)|nr:Ca2+/H+ antiporter, family [Acidobacteriota bacterium]
MLYLLLVSYSTVLVSELVGDKSIYTISSLATRFRPLYVFCGLAVAFMLKMLVAVLLGQVIATLPASLVGGVSAVTFFVTALVIWSKKGDAASTRKESDLYYPKAALIAFAAIFFSEWGDVGQITAATLTARYQMPLIVWLGASTALLTKGLLAVTLGRGLRRHIPGHVLRPVSAALCLLMGVVSAVATMLDWAGTKG